MLPVYFKTKNFTSFVRQLNMYDFRKVRNVRGYHEFRHPYFKRGHFADLANIKRKNVLSQRGRISHDKGLNGREYRRLRDSLHHTKQALQAITGQNIRLIAANRNVVIKLYSFKLDYEAKLKKLLVILYSMLQNKDDNLLIFLKSQVSELEMAFDCGQNNVFEFQTMIL